VQILFAHVLRHVMPMVWMLFSFEISNTLMVTASLGFLGYFIGGDVWIEIGDFVARRISGSPELGQMLATSFTIIHEPWGMFAVGSVIFVTVLGFNLAGEGLRRRLAYQRDVEQSIYGYILSKIVPYIRKKVTRPALSWSHAHPVLTSVLLLAILALVAPLIVWRVRAVAEVKIEMDMPEHVWASEWHDPYGSMHTTVTGPINPELLWVYETQDKIKGGVAVNREGILYFGDNSGILYAVDSDGRTIWETTLPHPIVGSPALGAASSIYVSDEQATLYAITPKGELLWSYSPEIQRTPTNGPVIGNDGTIYSGFGSNLMAVNPKGELIWHLPLPYDQYQNPPRLSVDGQWIFHDKVVVDSASGSLNEWPTMDDMDIALTGLDGKHYARAGNLVMVWESLLDDIAIVQSAKWDSSAFTFINPRCSGITEEGIIWMAYLAQRNPVVVWMNIEGNVMNTAAGERIERPVLIGLDGNDTAYLCGHKPAGTAVCNALVRDSHSPLWSVELVPEEENQVKGGAIAPGRLYVTLYDGYVVALGED
jgi:hypothetical protein